MSSTTINAFRQLWIDASRPAGYSMTAREMALESHNLSRDGSLATCSDGRVFVWVGADSLWIRCR